MDSAEGASLRGAPLFAPLSSDIDAPLQDRYASVRSLTETLAEPLSPEDQCIQSMPIVSPTKWHRAHTSWFFETFLLAPQLADYVSFNDSYGYLFNSYYQAVGPQHPQPNRGLISRPSVFEVGDYRRYVDDAMLTLLEDLPAELEPLVELGLHHEQQHQELLLMDIKHVLAQNPQNPAYRNLSTSYSEADPYVSQSAVQSLHNAGGHHHNTSGRHYEAGEHHRDWVNYEGGLVEIGFEPQDQSSNFCFDNETPRHSHLLQPFELASKAVTCGQWLEFILDGGYGKCDLWLSDGWNIVQTENWTAPLYWKSHETAVGWQDNGSSPRNNSPGSNSHQNNFNRSNSHQNSDWSEFTLDGLRPLDLDAPVCHVSYFEADAFARWAGARLPTEAEWEHAAKLQLASTGSPDPKGNFLDSGLLAPAPASTPAPAPTKGTGQAHPETALHLNALQPNTPLQLFGDVWEWTSSPYVGYPGFKPSAGAVGEYNGKFMINQHVLRGGCCVTPLGHIRSTYRNFFYPHMRWHFSGLRLARDCN